MVNIHSTLISIVYNVSNNIFPLSVSCPSIISDNPQSTSMALFKSLVLDQQNIFKEKLRVTLDNSSSKYLLVRLVLVLKTAT